MSKVVISREKFLEDRTGKAFSDVVNDAEMPFRDVLAFFNDESRQRRMEESEIHHDRPPLAGVVRELEALPSVDRFLREIHPPRSKRLRQAIGALVGMIMQQRGWRKTGRKGSLGVKAAEPGPNLPNHNSGGLALWFIRAERYECIAGMPFRSVRERSKEFDAPQTQNGKPKRRRKLSGRSGTGDER
jgi:hypothetical protein